MNKRRHRIRTAALSMIAALIVVWAGGLAWFVHQTTRTAPPVPVADGIVALTGGAGRVEAALQLLAAGQAQKLLISGVGGSAEFAALARRAGVDPALGSRVTLGRAAVTTRGNALEAAEWARANAITSLTVVTAYYHMPRAVLEISRTLPAVHLYPAPVITEAPWRLLIGEYDKYLLACIGLTQWERAP